jgi:serine/threonine protein kinase/Tfp pilus assembly protein PilF
MKHANQEKVMSIVGQAIAIDDEEQRRRHLETACGDDSQLRAEVEQLLGCKESAEVLFDRGIQQVRKLSSPADAPVPEQIGPYRLLERIGEGGMGEVWRCQQTHPIRRTVALKLIKPGMDTRQVIARFESERQALALMDHPNVAKVLDAGASESGRPYFVMEYVPGEPITSFCDRHRYTTRQRLELFLQACDAVQHAHQKAILHRDLKPTNILVMLQGERPLVKIIDFGIAKATGGKLTDATLFTQAGQLIGTPEYMSPEQAEMGGADVDTRSDIYSLGVVLYELITGALPFDSKALRSAGQEEIQKVLRQSEPPRPSARLSGLGDRALEVAQRRQTQVQELARQLRAELEWIPLKAIRKDRTQRYATPDQLAEDIRNYLESRPLLAGPESPSYRLRKFLRRNKGPVAAATLVLLILLAGITGTSIALIGQARARSEAERQRVDAERERAQSQAVANFLTDHVLAGATPDRIPEKPIRDTIVRVMLDPAAKAARNALNDQPLVRAAVETVLADCYVQLGRAELALPHANAALDLRRRLLGQDHIATIESMNAVAYVLQDQGRLADAESLFSEALERSRRALAPDHPQALLILGNLGQILQAQGKFLDAEPILRQAVAANQRVFGPEDLRTLVAINNLADALRAQGKFAEAETLMRDVLVVSRRAFGDEHRVTLQTINALGLLLRDSGKYEESEPFSREALQTCRRVLGDEHASTLAAAGNLAAVLHLRGNLVEAESLLRDTLEKLRKSAGDEHTKTLDVITNLGWNLRGQGKLSEAAPLLREAMEISRRTLGDANARTLGSIAKLAMVLEAQGNRDEAEPLYAELYQRAPTAQVPPPTIATWMARYGPFLVRSQRYEQAELPLREGLQRLEQAGQSAHPLMRSVLDGLALVCEHAGRREEASQWRIRLDELRATTKPSTTGHGDDSRSRFR